MRSSRWTAGIGRAVAAVGLACLTGFAVEAQGAGSDAGGPPSPPSRADIASFARIHVEVMRVRDSADVAVARQLRTPEAMQIWREGLERRTEEILHHAGMSRDEYRRWTHTLSVNDDARRTFDEIVAELTGVPLRPGQPPAGAATAAAASDTGIVLPPGPVGTHIGHVLTGFGDTPGGQGLLPVAKGEARVAAQHATLAARTPENLDAMKLHAAHVLHALDPTVVATGPGLGYGVKRAAQGVAAHIELSARTTGASANVTTHAAHVAAAARAVVERADRAVALARQIQAAGAAAEAAPLVARLAALCEQLTAGDDVNGDGRVVWGDGEGGLRHAEEHLTLLLVGERRAER